MRSSHARQRRAANGGCSPATRTGVVAASSSTRNCPSVSASWMEGACLSCKSRKPMAASRTSGVRPRASATRCSAREGSPPEPFSRPAARSSRLFSVSTGWRCARTVITRLTAAPDSGLTCSRPITSRCEPSSAPICARTSTLAISIFSPRRAPGIATTF